MKKLLYLLSIPILLNSCSSRELVLTEPYDSGFYFDNFRTVSSSCYPILLEFDQLESQAEEKHELNNKIVDGLFNLMKSSNGRKFIPHKLGNIKLGCKLCQKTQCHSILVLSGSVLNVSEGIEWAVDSRTLDELLTELQHNK